LPPERSRRRVAWIVAAVCGLAASVALPVRALAAPAPAPAPATPLRLFAAPDGTGVACTPGRPCGLLGAQARTRQASASRDVDVMLGGGTYAMSAPLGLAAADGGRNGHRVVYEAAPGATPVLSGGLAINGWTNDAATGTWSASVPAGTASRELYVNGVRAPRPSEALPGGGAWVQTDTGYVTSETRILQWRNP
jgi:hypothetical protein